jgi:hypothetical protein
VKKYEKEVELRVKAIGEGNSVEFVGRDNNASNDAAVA